MKIAILGDLHFGKHNDSIHLLNYQRKFFEEVFFPYLEKNNITTVIQMGDIFDKRKHINFNTLRHAKEMFFDELKARGITLYAIIGNHDTFFRSTIELNASTELLWGYPNIIIIDKPTNMYAFDADFIPWVAPNKEAEYLTFIERSTAKYCFGHLELTNAMISPGVFSTTGMSYKVFENYEKVFSGHYHIQSFYHNIHYIGTPYQLTFIDVSETKGFFIWEPTTNDLEFIENPNMLYVKRLVSNSSDLHKEDFEHKYVRLVVSDSTTNKELEKIYHTISEMNAIDIHIQEQVKIVEMREENESLKTRSSLDMIFEAIDEAPDEYNIEEVKIIVHELYQQAMIEDEE
jgi:DNA repair exonuclease SbcCD nuclease subunit